MLLRIFFGISLTTTMYTVYFIHLGLQVSAKDYFGEQNERKEQLELLAIFV